MLLNAASGGQGGCRHPTVHSMVPHNQELSGPKCQYCWGEETNMCKALGLAGLGNSDNSGMKQEHRVNEGNGKRWGWKCRLEPDREGSWTPNDEVLLKKKPQSIPGLVKRPEQSWLPAQGSFHPIIWPLSPPCVRQDKNDSWRTELAAQRKSLFTTYRIKSDPFVNT